MTQAMTIRRLKVTDLQGALKLTQAEKWPHRAEDWAFHFSLGQGWVACNQSDQVVGTILIWPFGDSGKISTTGLIVVDPSCQGQGIGRRLLQKAITCANNQELRLVSTAAGFKLYQNNGFEKIGLIRQCQGIPLQIPTVELPQGMVLRDLQTKDLRAITKLDSHAFGCTRQPLLQSLLDAGVGRALTNEKGIAAFAIIRQGGRGVQFGPIVAENDEQAKCLIASLLPDSTTFTRIDITDQAAGLVSWLYNMGMVQVDEVTYMALRPEQKSQPGNDAAASQTHTYALVSQALC